MAVVVMVAPAAPLRRMATHAAAVVEAAVAREQACRPEGVFWADWLRVRAARRAEMAPTLESSWASVARKRPACPVLAP